MSSGNPNKLNALFNEALRAEATHVAKTYSGNFHFIVNAVKGTCREFLQKLNEEAAATRRPGHVAKNPKNAKLALQKQHLETVLQKFVKEEKDWENAKARIEGLQAKENATPVERVISKVSTAEIDNVHDVVTQSVHGISLQVCTCFPDCSVTVLFRLITDVRCR